MSEGGMVLGPTSDASYRRGFFRMEPGDAVIMYTDGITEAMNPAEEEFGEDRVKAFVRENLERMSAKEMVDGLLGTVARYADEGRYVDDRTVVFIRRLN
jgi:sigma-B regulation protein RsbU (phosphoserine phosphatase)